MAHSARDILAKRRKRAELHKKSQEILDACGDEPSAEDLKKVEDIHREMEAMKAEIETMEAELDQEFGKKEAELQARENQIRYRELAARNDDFGQELQQSAGVEVGLEDDLFEPGGGSNAEAIHAALLQSLRWDEAPGLHQVLRPMEFDASRFRDEDPKTWATISSFGDIQLGYLLPPEPLTRIVTVEKRFGGMLRLNCSDLNTDHGNEVPIYVDDDTDAMGEYIEEGQDHDGGEAPDGEMKKIHAYYCTSRIVKAPLGFLADLGSNIEFEEWLFEKFGMRIGRRKNLAFTRGDGVGKPSGVETTAAVGHTTPEGQTNSITDVDLMELEHSVDRAYRLRGPDGSKFSCNDNTLLALKKLKKGDGDGVWLPGLALRAPDTILGFTYEVNNDLADIGPGNKPIAFGYWKGYQRRHVNQRWILRLREKFLNRLMIGFLYVERHDGKLINRQAVKFLQNAA